MGGCDAGASDLRECQLTSRAWGHNAPAWTARRDSSSSGLLLVILSVFIRERSPFVSQDVQLVGLSEQACSPSNITHEPRG